MRADKNVKLLLPKEKQNINDDKRAIQAGWLKVQAEITLPFLFFLANIFLGVSLTSSFKNPCSIRFEVIISLRIFLSTTGISSILSVLAFSIP